MGSSHSDLDVLAHSPQLEGDVTEQMSSQNLGKVLQIKFDQLRQNINIIKNALTEIDNVSNYAFFNQETRVMIEAHKQKEKINLF